MGHYLKEVYNYTIQVFMGYVNLEKEIETSSPLLRALSFQGHGA